VIVGVLVGVVVGVVVGVLVGVEVQVASGVPKNATTSVVPALLRFHTAKASVPLLAERLEDTFSGAPLELTLTAALHVEYGLLASRRLITPSSSNHTTILPSLAKYTDEID
jgi:hypothetical protein